MPGGEANTRANRFTIAKTTGDVGIGTAVPDRKLEIQAHGTQRLTIAKGTGKVGVGTNTPASLLTITASCALAATAAPRFRRSPRPTGWISRTTKA